MAARRRGKTFYEVLNVPLTASAEDIKLAYRNLAKLCAGGHSIKNIYRGHAEEPLTTPGTKPQTSLMPRRGSERLGENAGCERGIAAP